MKNLFLRIYQSKHFYPYRNSWILLGICLLFVILRFPSLFEPSWYGDEGIYQVVGHALNEGRVLYKEIWDNKPPLLYIFYALAQSDLFTVRLISTLFGLFSVIVFYFLSLKILRTTIAGFIATLVYSIIFATPIIEGNIANAENFMLFPMVAAAFLVYAYSRNKKNSYLIGAGFLLSVAFVTKIVAVFDAAAFFVFLFITLWVGKKEAIQKSIIFIVSFLSLFILSAVYFLFYNALGDFINGVFLQNVSYVGEQFGAKNPETILIVKTIILGIVIIGLYYYRNKISSPVLFIFLWVIFGIYNTLFSDRPYMHYLLVLLPAFSLLVGLVIENSKARIFGGILLVIILLLVSAHFGYYRKNIAYYQNYFQYMFNGKSTFQYLSFFDRNTPRDYQLANYIIANTSKDEPIFLISDSAQIYALSNKLPVGKYAVAYHITYFENAVSETKRLVSEVRPRLIITTTNQPIFEDLLSSYELRYIMEGAKIYEEKI